MRQRQVAAPARVCAEARPAALVAFAPLAVPRPMPSLTLRNHEVDPLGGVDTALALIDSELICSALQPAGVSSGCQQRVSDGIAESGSWIAASSS